MNINDYTLHELSKLCISKKDEVYNDKEFTKYSLILSTAENSKIVNFFIKRKKDIYEKYIDFRIYLYLAYTSIDQCIAKLSVAFGRTYTYEFGAGVISEIISIDAKTISINYFKDKEEESDELRNRVKQLIADLIKDTSECIDQKEEIDRINRKRQEEERRKRYNSFDNLFENYSRYCYEDRYRNFNRSSYQTPPRPEKPKNTIPYEVKKAFIELGIQSGSDVSVSIVKKAYKKMALKHHPDKGGSVEKMVEINNYYETAIKWLTRNK